MSGLLGHRGILLNTIDPDALILIERMTPTPSVQTQADIDAAIRSLKDAGLWTRLDSLYIPKKAEAQQAALLDWRRSTKAATLHGSATWSAAYGFVGSTAAGSYVNTDFTPSTDGVNITANSAGYGCYIVAAATASYSLIFGVNSLPDGNNTRTRLNYSIASGGNFGGNGNTVLHGYDFSAGGIASAAGSGGTGVLQINRTAANSMQVFKDSVSLGIGTNNNNNRTRPTLPIYITAENDLGTAASWSDAKVSAWWAGDVLTDAEQTTLATIIGTYFA